MPIYKVLYYPHVLLNKKSTPVENFSEELREFIKNLIQTGYEFEGGGIAAPQVGVNKRIFVSDFSKIFQDDHFERKENDFLVFDKDGKEIEAKFPMVFINSEIVETREPIVTNWEGCLSVPNTDSHNIPRFQYVEIRAQNEFGEFFSVKTSHLYAAVNFQHETDHLDGLLMVNRWNKSAYSQKDVVADIKDYENDPAERKRIKKLKLVEAAKIKFDFL